MDACPNQKQKRYHIPCPLTIAYWDSKEHHTQVYSKHQMDMKYKIENEEALLKHMEYKYERFGCMVK